VYWEPASELSGFRLNSDAGSQYTSIAFTIRLVEAGVDPSVGSVGDALDNALAETTVTGVPQFCVDIVGAAG
jgi:putative transposase